MVIIHNSTDRLQLTTNDGCGSVLYMATYKEETIVISVRIPKSFVNKLDQEASYSVRSRSQQLVAVLKEHFQDDNQLPDTTDHNNDPRESEEESAEEYIRKRAVDVVPSTRYRVE